MIRKILCSLVVLTILFGVYAYAIDFSSSAVIENTGNKKYKAIRLNSSIYNNTKENLADLMLFGSNNEVIPYFINSFSESSFETGKTYEMKLVNSFVKDEFFYMDYAIETSQTEDIIATSIEIDTNNSGFAKQIELWGGYDNINWEKVKDDIIYSIDDTQKLDIVLGSAKKYTHYRFKISNNLEKIFFTSVALNYNNIVQMKENFTETIATKFTAEEKDKTTIIKIPNMKNLKLNSITIETNSIFKRNVYFEKGQSKVLYNLNFKNTVYKDTTIPLYSYKVKSEYAELVIENKDDKPIEIVGIEVEYLVDDLVFDGSMGGNFTLKFGNNEMESPQSYDISNYKDHILYEGYDILNIKEMQVEPASSMKPQQDYKLFFNITIAAVALIMGLITFFKLKRQ